MVHRFGILECLRNIGVEEHDVGAGLVLLVVLPPDAGGEVVLGSELVVANGIVTTHTSSALWAPILWR